MTDTASPRTAPAVAPTSLRMTRSLTVHSDGPNVPHPSRWIPVPDTPIWPVLSTAAFLNKQKSSAPSILDAGSSAYVMAGRVAIGLALRLAGLDSGDKVLVPAFHCTSMVSPLSCMSASPVFYRVRPDLSVDVEDVVNKIDKNTRALVAVNYFGFPQDLRTLRKICDDHDLVFIEDCAHSFFGEYDGRPVGSYGHYAIGSLPKFFPVRAGGCLVSNDPKIADLNPRRRRLSMELRHFSAGIHDSLYCHRLALLKPVVRAVSLAQKGLKRRDSQNEGNQKAGAPMSEVDPFDPEWLDQGPTRISKWISRNVSTGRIIDRRRENFSQMISYFSGRNSCRPLFPQLPENVVPFMFPLWVDNLPAIFSQLEDQAVPLQRFGQFLWPGVDDSVCGKSAELSKRLVQLPCHQELHDDELAWIAETVGKVIRS